MSQKRVIAITLGDPGGIGPEVIARSLTDPNLPAGFEFEVLGLEAARKANLRLGKSTRESAQIAFNALEEAARGWKAGRYAAIVTGPVQKETIALIAPQPPGFVGQTEFFAQVCGLAEDRAIMALTDTKLTVGLATAHCSLKVALGLLTSERIVRTGQELHNFLVKTGLSEPRLAMAGLNPHAGEGGLFGDEEERMIRPAVEVLRKRGINVSGPYPPDTVFYQAVENRRFDAVICCYHDQGLIPFKLVAFHTGVNVTLGLPIIRTSPDHGTALDLAGTGKAGHHSMLTAIQLACRLSALNTPS